MSQNRPRDIQTAWFNVLRRLQAAGSTEGLSLISITVLVNRDGVPLLWLEPQCRKIEPKKSAQEVIEMLDDQDAASKL